MKEMFPKNLDEVISSSELRNLMLNIGSTIRRLRIQKGYRCAEYFAFEFQLNRSAYYGWENGKNISMKKLIIVCEALGITVNNLWVMLHRARLHLRNCLEVNWFKRVATKP